MRNWMHKRYAYYEACFVDSDAEIDMLKDHRTWSKWGSFILPLALILSFGRREKKRALSYSKNNFCLSDGINLVWRDRICVLTICKKLRTKFEKMLKGSNWFFLQVSKVVAQLSYSFQHPACHISERVQIDWHKKEKGIRCNWISFFLFAKHAKAFTNRKKWTNIQYCNKIESQYMMFKDKLGGLSRVCLKIKKSLYLIRYARIRLLRCSGSFPRWVTKAKAVLCSFHKLAGREKTEGRQKMRSLLFARRRKRSLYIRRRPEAPNIHTVAKKD